MRIEAQPDRKCFAAYSKTESGFRTDGAAAVLLSVLILCGSGCWGNSSLSHSPTFDLDGLVRLSEGKRLGCVDSNSGGLANLGDVDGDGSDDLLVAAPPSNRGPTRGLGWIEAYSGRTGRRIWQVAAMTNEQAQAAGLGQGFHFHDAWIIPDIDGDRFNDVYAIDDTSARYAFLISGKSGNIVDKLPAEGRDWWRRPIAFRQAEGGRAEFVFLTNRLSLNPRQPRFEFADAQNLNPTGQQNVDWKDPPPTQISLITSEFPDHNGDGHPEWLLRQGLRQNWDDPEYHWGIVVYCPRTLQRLREFTTNRPRISGNEHWSLVRDMPQVGTTALVMSTYG